MQLPIGGSQWIWLFVGLDVLLALLVYRRADLWAAGRRVLLLLAGGFAALAGAHALVGWQRDAGTIHPGSLAASSMIVAPAIIGVAALIPSMAATPSGAEQALKLRWSQLVGLAIAALVPVGAMALMLVVDDASRATVTVISASTLGIVLLSLTRMWGLVNRVRELTERQGHDRLAAMVEHSSDVVLLTDQSGAVSYASPGLLSTLGHQPATWVGRHLVDVIADEERGKVANQFRRLLEAGSGNTVEFEATLLRVDGHRRRANVVIANLLGGTAVDGIVATFRDITEQRNLERQLSHRAYHDELTGLANRALFLDRMDHALRVARSERDPVVVLFVDLDDFKGVNDEFGHAVGDHVLKSVSDCIRKSAGAGDTSARLGGDEFAILLEDVGGVDRAIDVAERLLNLLRVPVAVAGYDMTVLASIGVAVATPNMNTTSLLRDADIAMYEAKRAGKGQIRIFDPAMRMVATKHLEYRTELGDALEDGQLRLVYMPFVDMRTGEVRGAEALDPLAPPPARRHLTDRVRADRRAHRSHRADRRLDPRRGARAGGGLATGRRALREHQRVGGAGSPAGLRRTRDGGARTSSRRTADADGRDGRERARRGERSRRRCGRRAPSARRSDRDRRLRCRALLAQLSPTSPGRHDQDRSRVHRRVGP